MGAKCQENTGECKAMTAMQGNDRGIYGSVCNVPVEFTGMPGEFKGVGAMC